MGFETLEKVELNPTEYCFLREDTSHYSDTFKLFIPKLMPFFSYAEPPIVTSTSMGSVYINSAPTHPNPSTSITVQNFVTLKRHRNSWFRLHPIIFRWKTRFVVKIIDNNIRNMLLIDDEYNEMYVVPPKPVYVRNPIFELLDVLKIGDLIKYSYGDDTGMATTEGRITQLFDWGVKVDGLYIIAASKILGFHKPPGEYYSYY